MTLIRREPREQSQMPAVPRDRLEREVYPFARMLSQRVRAASPGAKIAFYQTMAKRNGDAQFFPDIPEMRTYEGMQKRINAAYAEMTKDNRGLLDTSAVAKFYVPEKESRSIRRLLEQADRVCVSELVRPEIMAVFHRRLRGGSWNRRDFLAAVRQFQHDDLAGFWTWLPVGGFILRAAAEIFATLPPTIFLRASDCIHLVTALHHDFTEFLTFDAQQTRAATALGLTPVTG